MRDISRSIARREPQATRGDVGRRLSSLIPHPSSLLAALAIRNLTRRPARTAVTTAGVALAVAAFFSIISFQRGYQRGLSLELDRLGAHLLVVPKGCPYDAAS